MNDGTASNWWGATGSWTAYQGGVPGYFGSVVTTGYMDIYLRIDNIREDKVLLLSNAVLANQFY